MAASFIRRAEMNVVLNWFEELKQRIPVVKIPNTCLDDRSHA